MIGVLMLLRYYIELRLENEIYLKKKVGDVLISFCVKMKMVEMLLM
ncbi:hypothetical protein GCM10009430_28170 [Aquimarina litoralis]|uniref:Uncharacterized protein n=1 Tax=Aquimarina litoralis TaxID=584605 RepID=A0ABP3U7W4_9FLAO